MFKLASNVVLTILQAPQRIGFDLQHNQLKSNTMSNLSNAVAAVVARMNPSNPAEAMANKTVRIAYSANHPPVEGGAVYEKVLVFFNAEQQQQNFKELSTICSNLEKAWLEPDKMNRNLALRLRSDILVFAHKWGNLMVPANLRFCLHLYERKFDIPVSDFGDDTGVIQGKPFVLDQEFWSDDVWRSTRIPDTVDDCSGVSITYKMKLRYGQYGSSKPYGKLVPFISVGEKDDWWKDAKFVDGCFTTVDMMENGPPRYLTDELKSRLVTKMKKAVSAVTSFTDKWGCCRLPGNIRENCHIFQYVLGEKMFEFGKDYGVYEGTPYENIPPAYFIRSSYLCFSVSK